MLPIVSGDHTVTASPGAAFFHMARLRDALRARAPSDWNQIADLLPLMCFPEHAVDILQCCVTVRDLLSTTSALSSAPALSRLKAAFAQHPDWICLYAVMRVNEDFRRAVCRDDKLRPLLRQGVAALLAWLATPHGAQYFKQSMPEELNGVTYCTACLSPSDGKNASLYPAPRAAAQPVCLLDRALPADYTGSDQACVKRALSLAP